ncbi:hypothetical protein [Candidatus Cardinium hertigii]|uniref:Proline/betaine transporter n=1 Tax=Candidatus Cardinium hertigii TaxID=247481 RepID=A0A2Z3LIH5_9BACT|nr:hypothetical protein [Candidatus Cardinium hertigii]AWN81860.1 Proline/betaine transporter [Candidatus Cardinium hertigii]
MRFSREKVWVSVTAEKSAMSLTKQRQSIIIANAVIHFDNALYGYMVPMLAPLFFPEKETTLQLILGYSILITACIAKPLGGFLFCLFTAYVAEKRLLCYILLGASICQLFMGCLPIYSALPWWGSLGLLVARFCMEICAAGEYHIARLYLMQQTDCRQAKLFSARYERATMVGITFASLVATVLIGRNPILFYWRLPFIIAGLITLLNLIFFRWGHSSFLQLDRGMGVRPSFASLWEQLWQGRNAIIPIAVVMGFGYLTYAVPFLFMPKFIPMIATIPYVHMMQHTTLFMLVDIVLLGWVGVVGPKFTPRLLMLGASSMVALSIIPIFMGLQEASMGFVIFARFWLVAWGVIFSCFITVWCKEQTHSTNPYCVVGFATVLGTGLLGKPTAAICWVLYRTYGSPFAPACYIALFASITVVTLVKTGKK